MATLAQVKSAVDASRAAMMPQIVAWQMTERWARQAEDGKPKFRQVISSMDKVPNINANPKAQIAKSLKDSGNPRVYTWGKVNDKVGGQLPDTTDTRSWIDELWQPKTGRAGFAYTEQIEDGGTIYQHRTTYWAANDDQLAMIIDDDWTAVSDNF